MEVNNEPWFVLKDVCKVLRLTDTGRTAERLDSDELTRTTLVSGGQKREMICINESGLYNVILRSDKPEAKPFRKWVTSEVLPTIRKHGAYMTPETLQEAILNPDMMTKGCPKWTLPVASRKDVWIQGIPIPSTILPLNADIATHLPPAANLPCASCNAVNIEL